MRYIVDPQSLVFSSKRINGFVEFINDNDVKQWDLLNIATDVVDEWSEYYYGGDFGSSDMTYMIKSFIDEVISASGKNGYKTTRFIPQLSVVDYSEAEHHDRIQRMEYGF